MIATLNISNFRSIKELYVEPRQLCSLIGPNSTGKTNILRAIDLVIGEGWTTKAKVARELFNDSKKPVSIDITFTTPIIVPGAGYQGANLEVYSINLTLILHPELSAKTTINGGKTFYGQEQFKRVCHFIYIPSERNLSSELRVSQWTMLGKMMKVVYENYIAHYGGNEEKLKADFGGIMNPAKTFLENDFSEKAITFKKFSDKFVAKCLENSNGLANEFHPVLDIYNINWFYKTLQIQVKENIADKNFDSEDVGAGMQNLLMISIFQTYAELMGGKVIFGIEEPEIYLYPQAQRSLYKSFQLLSKQTQILYTTHNPNFIDAQRAYEIEMLQKDNKQGTYKFEKHKFINEIEAEKQKFKIYSHFNTERNEIFFAKKVLLVEGASDKILFTTLLEEKYKIDINLCGISIIECGGKGGVIYFAGLCLAMGMDNYFAVWDADEEVDDKYEVLNTLIKNGNGLELKPNLEGFLNSKIEELKLSSNSSEKIKQAYEFATSVQVNSLPTEFEMIRKFFEPFKVEKNAIAQV